MKSSLTKVLLLLLPLPLAIMLVCPAMYARAETDTGTKLIVDIIDGNEVERNNAYGVISKKTPLELVPFIIKNIEGKRDLEIQKRLLFALKLYPVRDTFPQWLALLKSTNSFPVKIAIIDFIITSNDRRIVMPLVDELNSPFATVRERAILGLKKIGDDRMFPYVLNMAHDPDPIKRVYALEAINHLYDRRVRGLLNEMLKDDNKSVRYYVLKCVENNRLVEMLPSIRTIAINDANWEVRIKAIDILREFNDTRAIYVLVRCLTDGNRDIRYATAKALYYFRAASTAYAVSGQLWKEDDDEIKQLLIDTLVRLKNGGGFRGLEKVLTQDKNVSLRIQAAYAIGAIGDARGLSLLMSALDDSNCRVQAEACFSLGLFRAQRGSVVRLLNVVNNETNLYVRTSALYSLRRMGDRTALTPLFDLYASETDPVFKEKLRVTVRNFITK